MATKNAFDQSLRQVRSNVLPFCAPSARLALDDIPLFGDLNEFLALDKFLPQTRSHRPEA
jgi:hypothetical protein